MRWYVSKNATRTHPLQAIKRFSAKGNGWWRGLQGWVAGEHGIYGDQTGKLEHCTCSGNATRTRWGEANCCAATATSPNGNYVCNFYYATYAQGLLLIEMAACNDTDGNS